MPDPDPRTWSRAYTREFFGAVLRALGAPVTDENIAFLTNWMAAENTTAGYNPLATSRTKDVPNAGDAFNSAGVRSYGSIQDGIHAPNTPNLSLIHI